jgi:ATP synthase protein I
MPEPVHDRDQPSESRSEILRRAGPYLGIGSTFLAAIATCLFGGWWLDGWLGTSPWLTLAGALLGITAGFYMFLKIVLSARGDVEDDGER